MDAKTGDMGCPVDRPTTVRSLLGRTNRDWWPESLPIEILHQGGVSPDPMGEEFDYAEAFKKLDYAGAQARSDRADDRQPALVAGRLRALWAVLHPHGLARGRHLPDRRRPRRRQQRQPALRSAQQLAGQRQPRQGAAAAVADQAEVRQAAQLGRPVHPRRQRRDRIDGRSGVRLRRRPTGRLRGRARHLLGRRGEVGRRAQKPASSPSASWSSSTRSRRSRWASSTSIRKVPAAIPTRFSRRATSRSPSSGWR